MALPMIDYDFDNPCDFDEFLERVTKRANVVAKMIEERRAPNEYAHPTPPPHTQWSIWGFWMEDD